VGADQSIFHPVTSGAYATQIVHHSIVEDWRLSTQCYSERSFLESLALPSWSMQAAPTKHPRKVENTKKSPKFRYRPAIGTAIEEMSNTKPSVCQTSLLMSYSGGIFTRPKSPKNTTAAIAK
jgi:hypothetical protein